MKVAHFGTFDVENYGDLMFPLILERRLGDICEDFTHVSPAGGPPVWEDCVSSVPAERFLRERPETDGVVIGGGHIVRASRTPMKSYDAGGFSSHFAYPSLWLGAAYAAARDGLPLCWNAPGVTEEFPGIASRLARWTASVSDYVSVRDKESRRLLQGAGAGGGAELAPDSVIEVSRLWSEEEVSAAYEEAFAHRGQQVPERTIAFHLALRWATESDEEIAGRLDRISQRFDATPILIAIGPCHGDSGLQRRVAEHMSTGPLVVDHPRSLREVAACIACSEAYVGSSMHGMITACSFGKRGMLVASEEVAKFKGFLERYHLAAWMSGSWEEAERRAGEFAGAPSGIWERVLEAATPALDEHWGRIRAALASGVSPQKREAVSRLHEIGEELSGTDSIYQGIVVENLQNASSRPGANQRLAELQEQRRKERQEFEEQIEQQRQTIQRQEQDIKSLAGWIGRLENGLSALLGSRQWKAGRAVGELHRRALRRPRVPMASNHMLNTLQEFRSWQKNRGREPGAQSPAPAGGAGAKPRSDSGEAKGDGEDPGRRALVASGTRLLRRLSSQRPRMPKKRLAREVRGRIGPAPDLPRTPSVSVVVLNRNGLDHLKQLFAGLKDHTDYPNFEVIVVDNGSSDGSVEFVRSFGQAHFPVQRVANQTNASFSEGNNQGAELATGELLLFANNDIEPFESGWLTEMVRCMEERRAGVVGARLLYLQPHDAAPASGYAVQHRGVKFRNKPRFAQHFNVGMGEDALDEHLGDEASCPAVTAACLLVGRETFEEVGGFTTGYRYGSEDVDLCLKARSAGHDVACSGRAVLLHDESSSQRREGSSFSRINRTGNWRLFKERWGPQLQRWFLLDRLSAEGFWTDERAHIAVAVTGEGEAREDWLVARELGQSLQRLGWRVTYVERERWYELPGDAEYLLVMHEDYDISRVAGVTTIAWIRGGAQQWTRQSWFERFDMVLAASNLSREYVESNTSREVAALFPAATNPGRFAGSAPETTYESDYVFAGNHHGRDRLVNVLDVGSEETFMIFGNGWEKAPWASRYARGPLPYDELSKAYSSAKLALDEAAPPARSAGAVNPRVLDALAAGTLPVTNCEPGVSELFDEEFPTYSSRRQLRETLDLLLSDDSHRNELARRYQSVVLAEHTYDHRARQLTGLLHRRAEALSFCIKIGPRDWERARLWGDTYFARAMQKQLERRGHPCAIQVFEEWDSLEGMKYDVAIHLKGLTPYTTKPGQLNILWNISHPEGITARECEKYDLAFTASERWAQSLSAETRTPVVFLEQATDPEVFYPDYDQEHDHDLVFVGNSRGVHRRIVRDLLPADGEALGYDLALWGKGWEKIIDNDYISGIHLPNEEVKKAYSSASIVLNDHWDDMREYGFISNRIYDALACGALIISDDLPELRERFGDAVVTYESPEELKSLIDHYLASPEERKAKGRRGRELVLEHHTFEHRMESMLSQISSLSLEKEVYNLKS